MALESFISVASKVAEYAVDPIARQIGYVINYKRNVDNFKEEVKRLKGSRDSVQDTVDEKKRNGNEIKQNVDKWLNSVTEITEDAGKLIVEDEDKAKKRCLNGWCPNLKSRYQLSKKAKKKMEAVVKLKGEGNFPSVAHCVPLPGIWSTSTEGYVALESRMTALKEIMEALKSSNLSVIGVYGMGGVGKTTLVEQVGRKAEEDKLFDRVFMVTVKEPPNVKEIQATIADKLGLEFDPKTDKSEEGRAYRLRTRLNNEKKKILIILDNVCSGLVLNHIGIPFGDANQNNGCLKTNEEKEGSCKLLLTSRNQDVLSEEMGTQKDFEEGSCKLLLTSRNQGVLSHEMGTQKDFLVGSLPEDDAWSLFEKMVGDVVKDAKVQPIATKVAKRCAGLPVMIVIVASALRNNKSLYDWKDALKKLERVDIEEEMTAKVFSAIDLSYKHLKGEEVKSLFLLCGQLRHFIPIGDLLKYSLGLGIFKKINNLEEARNRVHKLVDDLKASCLLIEGESPMIVKMHDFVHDFAICIASRDHHVFCVDGNSEVKEWPTKDKLKQCRAIAFPEPIIHELPEELQCPQVKSFFLYSRDDRSLKIPENFFRGMEKLRVLDLTRVHLLSLPSSLQFLENLRTLCLDYCVLGDIAALGELKKLEILSLIDSNIVRLPTEIGKLTRLQLLDLSDCSKLEVISPGVLSSLSQLVDLYMGNSFVQWEIEESNSQRSNASLAELMNLSNLKCLDIHIPDAKIVPKEFFSERLERYQILIGAELDWSGMDRTSRMLKLKLHICLQMEYGVKKLLKGTEDLYLYELNGVENVLFDLDDEGFPLLKHLSVQNSPEILYIINSKGRVSCSAFPILESLILDKLINLEKIFHGQLAVGSFAKLRSIKVDGCHKLRYLFSISLASGLTQLQEIDVTECEIMEEIVADRREDDANYNAAIDKIEFTRLSSLTLQHLRQLKRFSSIAKMPSASQRGQKLLTSDTRSKEIISEDELTTPTSLFNEKVVFPKLQDLKLFSINIEKIWDDQLLAMSSHLQNLTHLIVDGCGSLRNVCALSLALALMQLEEMEVKNCPMIEKIITTGVGEAEIDKIVFPQLSSIILESLPNLTSFYSGTSVLECPSLNDITIIDCPNMKTFTTTFLWEHEPKIAGEGDEQRIGKGELCITIAPFFNEKVVFPNLEALKLCSVGIEKIWDDQISAISYCIQNLTILIVADCGRLRYLFTSCMVKSLGQLKHLDIHECKIMEEIIFTEGSQEGWMNKMLFPKLERLFLKALHNSQDSALQILLNV